MYNGRLYNDIMHRDVTRKMIKGHPGNVQGGKDASIDR